MQSRNKANQGFSLIELLVVVAIVGIISGIGFASYESYAIKVNMAEAQRFALAMTAEAEAFYQENGRFPGINAKEEAVVPLTNNDTIRGYSYWTNSGRTMGTNGTVYARGQIGTVQIYFNEDIYPGATDHVRLTYDFLPDAFGNGEWVCVKHYHAHHAIAKEYLPDGCDNTMRFK